MTEGSHDTWWDCNSRCISRISQLVPSKVKPPQGLAGLIHFPQKTCPWAVSPRGGKPSRGLYCASGSSVPFLEGRTSQSLPFPFLPWLQVTNHLFSALTFTWRSAKEFCRAQGGQEEMSGTWLHPLPIPTVAYFSTRREGSRAFPRSQAGKGIEGSTALLYIQWQ